MAGTDPLIRLLYQSWSDLDHAIDGLTVEEAVLRFENASSIAWTVGHLAFDIDVWLNRRLQGLPAHKLIRRRFATGGTGEASDWLEIVDATSEVRASARQLIDATPPPDLERAIPYDGPVEYLRQPGLTLGYALMAVASHHFQHAGEILTLRSRMGPSVPDEAGWGRGLVD